MCRGLVALDQDVCEESILSSVSASHPWIKQQTHATGTVNRKQGWLNDSDLSTVHGWTDPARPDPTQSPTVNSSSPWLPRSPSLPAVPDSPSCDDSFLASSDCSAQETTSPPSVSSNSPLRAMEQEPSDDQAVALLRRVRLNNSDLASILRLQTVWPDEAAALQRYCTDLVAGTAWGKEHVAWSSGSQPPERMPRPSGCTRRLRLKTGDLSDQRKSSFPIFDTIPAALQQVKAPSSLELLGQEGSPTTSKLLRNVCVSERTVYFFNDTGRGIPDRIDLGDRAGYLQVRSHRTCHEMAH